MDEHPNAARLRAGHAAFGQGDLTTVGELLADDVVYHFPGHSPLAAEHKGRAEVFGFWGRQFELSGGTLQVAPSVIVANDDYGFVLVRISAQ